MKYTQKLLALVAVFLSFIVFGSSLHIASAAPAADPKSAVCGGVGIGSGASDCTGTTNLDDTIKLIINILSVIVGIAAVIMIILGGLKFITSNGDANKIGSAKNTLLYAIIGLVIVVLAQVIVRFTVGKVTSAPTAAPCVATPAKPCPQ
jgi:magnesium-transporting ATPase (P-type)